MDAPTIDIRLRAAALVGVPAPTPITSDEVLAADAKRIVHGHVRASDEVIARASARQNANAGPLDTRRLGEIHNVTLPAFRKHRARLQASPSPALQTPAALAAREEVSGVRLLPKRRKSHGAAHTSASTSKQQEEAAARLILPSEERRLKRAHAKRTDAQEPGLEAQLVTVALPIVQRFVGQHRQFKASHRRMLLDRVVAVLQRRFVQHFAEWHAWREAHDNGAGLRGPEGVSSGSVFSRHANEVRARSNFLVNALRELRAEELVAKEAKKLFLECFPTTGATLISAMAPTKARAARAKQRHSARISGTVSAFVSSARAEAMEAKVSDKGVLGLSASELEDWTRLRKQQTRFARLRRAASAVRSQDSKTGEDLARAGARERNAMNLRLRKARLVQLPARHGGLRDWLDDAARARGPVVPHKPAAQGPHRRPLQHLYSPMPSSSRARPIGSSFPGRLKPQYTAQHAPGVPGVAVDSSGDHTRARRYSTMSQHSSSSSSCSSDSGSSWTGSSTSTSSSTSAHGSNNSGSGSDSGSDSGSGSGGGSGGGGDSDHGSVHARGGGVDDGDDGEEDAFGLDRAPTVDIEKPHPPHLRTGRPRYLRRPQHLAGGPRGTQRAARASSAVPEPSQRSNSAMTYDTFLGSHRVTPTMALPATDGGDDTAASQPSRTATRASSQRPRLASQLGVRFQDAKVSSALPGVASPAAGAEVQRAGQAPEQTLAHAASASKGVAEQPSLSLLEEYPVSMEVTAALHGSDKASASPHEPDLGEPSTRYASCLAPAVCNVEAYGSDLSMHVIGPVVGACVPLSLAEDALPVLDMLTVDVLHEPTPYGGATGKGSATAAPPSLGQEAQHQDEIRRSVVSMYHLVQADVQATTQSAVHLGDRRLAAVHHLHNARHGIAPSRAAARDAATRRHSMVGDHKAVVASAHAAAHALAQLDAHRDHGGAAAATKSASASSSAAAAAAAVGGLALHAHDSHDGAAASHHSKARRVRYDFVDPPLPVPPIGHSAFLGESRRELSDNDDGGSETSDSSDGDDDDDDAAGAVGSGKLRGVLAQSGLPVLFGDEVQFPYRLHANVFGRQWLHEEVAGHSYTIAPQVADDTDSSSSDDDEAGAPVASLESNADRVVANSGAHAALAAWGLSTKRRGTAATSLQARDAGFERQQQVTRSGIGSRLAALADSEDNPVETTLELERALRRVCCPDTATAMLRAQRYHVRRLTYGIRQALSSGNDSSSGSEAAARFVRTLQGTAPVDGNGDTDRANMGHHERGDAAAAQRVRPLPLRRRGSARYHSLRLFHEIGGADAAPDPTINDSAALSLLGRPLTLGILDDPELQQSQAKALAAIDELADAFVEDEEHEAGATGSKSDWSSSLRSVAAPSGKPAWGSSTNSNNNNKSGRGSTNTVSSKRDLVVPPLAAAAALDVINPLAEVHVSLVDRLTAVMTSLHMSPAVQLDVSLKYTGNIQSLHLARRASERLRHVLLAWERAAAAVSQREAVLLSALGRLTDGHGRLLTDVLRDKARATLNSTDLSVEGFVSRSDRPRRAALKQLVLASEWVIVCAEQLFAAGEVLTYHNELYLDKMRRDYKPLVRAGYGPRGAAVANEVAANVAQSWLEKLRRKAGF